MAQTSTWSSEQDEILIDFVRNHEIIYNIKSKEYRNAQAKQNAWKEIGTILHTTDVDCSKRWAYIRDYYIRRRGKPGTGSSGEAARKRSKLLSFLDSYSSEKRSTITNVETPTTSHNTEEEAADTEIDNEEGYISYQADGIQHESPLEEEDRTVQREGDKERSYTKSDTPQRSKKRQKTSHSEERIQLLRKIADRQVPVTPEATDDNDLFFSSMAKSVKRLPRLEQIRIRMEVANLIGNAELTYLSATPHHNRAMSGSGSYSHYVSDNTTPGYNSRATSVADSYFVSDDAFSPALSANAEEFSDTSTLQLL